MINKNMDERLTKLESTVDRLYKQKNEFLGMGGTKKEDETAYADKLFNQFPYLKKVLVTSHGGTTKQFFMYLTLSSKVKEGLYKKIFFTIQSLKNKSNEMQCSAFRNSNSPDAKFGPFDLKSASDIVKVGNFINSQLDKAKVQ
jgi:hypothetical protein